MPDRQDELIDTLNRISEGQPPAASVRADYVYVVYISGRWTPGTCMNVTPSQCNADIQETHKVDLGDPTVRWARGHVGPEGNFIIHPANDRAAVTCITELLKSKMRKR